MVTWLEHNTKRRVTIISPTAAEEETCGYDDILAGLPPGRTIALQFKRPHMKKHGYVDFEISETQKNALRYEIRRQNYAFYVFSPFPLIGEMLESREVLLQSTVIVDIWNHALNSPNIRTIRISKIPDIQVKIVNRSGGQEISNFKMANTLCSDLRNGKIGRYYSGTSFSESGNLNELFHMDSSDEAERNIGNTRFSYLHLSD